MSFLTASAVAETALICFSCFSQGFRESIACATLSRRIMDLLRQIFGPGDFMPHGYCSLWNPGLVWLNVISDSLIALSYFSIPFALLWLVRKRRDLPFGFVFILFGVFILTCGSIYVAGSLESLAFGILAGGHLEGHYRGGLHRHRCRRSSPASAGRRSAQYLQMADRQCRLEKRNSRAPRIGGQSPFFRRQLFATHRLAETLRSARSRPPHSGYSRSSTRQNQRA